MGSLKEVNKIEGVATQPLKEVTDGLGSVLHMLRNDSPLFKKFGEIYFSEINPKTIKAPIMVSFFVGQVTLKVSCLTS